MDWRDPNIAKFYKPGEALTAPFSLALVQRAFFTDGTLTDPLVVLDNATGTGIVAVHIHETLPDAAKQRLQLTCGDISPGMVEAVQSRIAASGWQATTTARIIDMQSKKMDAPPDTYTHLFTNFGLVGPFDISSPSAVLAEWRRVLRPGGIAAFTIWEYVGWFGFVERAVQSLGPDAPHFPPWHEFCRSGEAADGEAGWERREHWEPKVVAAGFVDVRVESMETETRDKDVGEFCGGLGSSLAVIAQKFWSGEEKVRFGPQMVPAMERVLREEFGEGEVVLGWRAWVVTARKPGEE